MHILLSSGVFSVLKSCVHEQKSFMFVIEEILDIKNFILFVIEKILGGVKFSFQNFSWL